MSETKGAEEAEAKVEKMFEYGYRKSNYGPDELVTDAHGNPISVVDAMLSVEGCRDGDGHAASVLLQSAHPRQYRVGDSPVCGDRHHPASGGAAGVQSSRYQAASCRA